MTPHDDHIDLTRDEFVDLIEMRKDIKYIMAFIKGLPCATHIKLISEFKGRMLVFGVIVPILAGLMGVLLGHFLKG